MPGKQEKKARIICGTSSSPGIKELLRNIPAWFVVSKLIVQESLKEVRICQKVRSWRKVQAQNLADGLLAANWFFFYFT